MMIAFYVPFLLFRSPHKVVNPSQHIHDQAALYAAGLLGPAERVAFECLMERDPEVQNIAREFQDTSAELILAAAADSPRAVPTFDAERVKRGILAKIAEVPQQQSKDAVVITCAKGLIEWVNPAFTDMCGYTIDELIGKKPGTLLQGPDTDPTTVQRIRSAIAAVEPCEERLVNYHKNGEPYTVDVAISPVHDDNGDLRWFVAREQKVAEAWAA